MKIKDIKIKDQELLNNLLYNTSVVNQILHKKLEMKTQMLTLLMTMIVVNIAKIITMIDTEITIDIAVTVEIIPKIVIDLTLGKDITITLEVHIDLDTKIITNEELHLDLHIDLHTEISLITDTILDPDTDLFLNHNSFKRYNYPYRSPSRPRDFRSRSRTPSQNRPQNRINQVDVESTNDEDSTKFEIHICQITEIANTITPYSWFYPLYVHTSETKDHLIPSKLAILFHLDTGASISVLNLPTFHVISKQLNLNVPKNIENKRAKTLTVANQTEIPIIHYISLTCFTEVNHQNRLFNIDFAVANIKYNILGKPFFKRHIQNIDFQQNIMTYKEQHSKLLTKTHFST